MGFERFWHKSYVSGVPGEADIEKITMPEVLERNARRFPSVFTLNFLGKKFSFKEFNALVDRFANALIDLGVKKGDMVAMLLPNIPQLVIANYATYKIGGVTVVINPLYTERELEYQINDSDSTTLITLDLLLPRALSLKGKTGVKRIITCHINDFLPFPVKQLYPFVKKRCTGRWNHKRACISLWTSSENIPILPLKFRHSGTTLPPLSIREVRPVSAKGSC